MGNNSRGARVLHLFSLFPKQNLPHSYLSCPACCAEWHSSIVAWLQPGTRASLHSCIVAQLQHSRAASSLQPSSSAPRHTCKMACMVAPWKAVLQKSCIVAQLHQWHGCTMAKLHCSTACMPSGSSCLLLPCSSSPLPVTRMEQHICWLSQPFSWRYHKKRFLLGRADVCANLLLFTYLLLSMKTSHLGTLRALHISATESAHAVSLHGILMPPDHSQSLSPCSITIRLPIFLPDWIQQRPVLQRENATSAHCGAFPGEAAQRRRGNHAVSTASSQPRGSRAAHNA